MYRFEAGKERRIIQHSNYFACIFGRVKRLMILVQRYNLTTTVINKKQTISYMVSEKESKNSQILQMKILRENEN
jgi:hypothetical protein